MKFIIPFNVGNNLVTQTKALMFEFLPIPTYIIPFQDASPTTLQQPCCIDDLDTKLTYNI